jgi:beta-1,4-mannosyl-glycoprotein beta-1,4-N-acetylglucosaminyltransferase
MIYDCFAFFNELDLLEIRLEELFPVVDKFVLVEATRTFQGNPKPLYFRENQDRFQKYMDKITVITVDQYPNFWTKFRKPKPFDLDNHQKEQIKLGLKNAKPDDLVIISDLDEIPSRAGISYCIENPGFYVFEQRLFYYFLDYQCSHFHIEGKVPVAHYNLNGIGYWRGSVMIPLRQLESVKKTRMLRSLPQDERNIMRDSGWHFSYLGGLEAIIKKLQSYAHKEHNNDAFTNPEKLRLRISEGKSLFDPLTTFKKVVFPDGDFPGPIALMEHHEKYQHLLLPPDPSLLK